MKQLALGVTLRANALFANFYPGPNEEVLAALQGPGADPIWVVGKRGLRQEPFTASPVRGHRRTRRLHSPGLDRFRRGAASRGAARIRGLRCGVCG